MNRLAARLAALLLTISAVAPATAQLLPPLGSLIVSLDSPSGGSTVSGTIPVSASVGIVGSLTVSRVEFFVDGSFIGSDSGSPYSVSWNTTNVGNGSHSLTAVAIDLLGLRFNSNAVTVTVSNGPPPDTTRPTVTINQASGQADPTSASSINFTAVFSEPVTGFTNTDVAIGGTAGGTKTATVSGGPSTYNVAVSGMTGSGTVTATIAAGVASDAAGNTNTASTSTDNSVTFETAPSAPTITSFSPTSGPAETIVTISGTNFHGATAVTFNGVSAAFLVDSATSMRAQVPAGATTGPISVTTPGGTATSSTSFTVATTAAPTITSFSPTNGPVGTIVTISGANFTGATAVTFNGVSAAEFVVDSATSMRARVPAGATTGAIGVTTPGGTATSASSFTVTASTSASRSEESAATFAGTGWTLRGAEIAAFSGGTAGSSNVGGETASFTFTGTGVSWIGLRCNICGIATVSIDGGAPVSVDTAGAAAVGSPGLASEVVFTSAPLADGTHTLVITVTGNTNSGGAHIVVDAFDVTGGSGVSVTRIEENNASVSYIGTWNEFLDPRVSGGRVVEAVDAGARATLSFTGSAVTWIGARGPFGGIANVYVDGVQQGQVDTYAPAEEAQVRLFTASGLAPTSHTLSIEATGTARPEATKTGVIVDAFDLTP